MKSTFSKFLQGRGSRFGWFARKKVRAAPLIFKKGEPGYSRRLKLRGANGGRNVSRLKVRRPLRGHLQGTAQLRNLAQKLER